MTTDAIVMPTTELDLEKVLLSGQTFRWQRDDQGWWISPIGSDGTILRAQQESGVLYVEACGGRAKDIAALYFHAGTSLLSLRDRWLSDDALELAVAIDNSPGLRIVRQDPVECLFSFLCSSAAPIHRIRRSVDGMSRLLGRDLGVHHGVQLWAFPEVERLAGVLRADLDSLGLGFRGRYIGDAARMVVERGGSHWLASLRSATYEEAKLELVQIPGVGEKVADCVCLFSLDKHQAVPIDVHMARVARRKFDECRDVKSITPKAYETFSGSFRARFGEFAGWAQQYFFYAEIERRGLWDQELGRHRPKPLSP